MIFGPNVSLTAEVIPNKWAWARAFSESGTPWDWFYILTDEWIKSLALFGNMPRVSSAETEVDFWKTCTRTEEGEFNLRVIQRLHCIKQRADFFDSVLKAGVARATNTPAAGSTNLLQLWNYSHNPEICDFTVCGAFDYFVTAEIYSTTNQTDEQMKLQSAGVGLTDSLL